MPPKTKYHDIKFFLVAIIFINAFNYYLTYNNVRFNWYFIFTFCNDTVQGWIAWWAVRSIIIFLDQKMPYADNPLKRILAQLFLTSTAGLLIIIILTELASWIVKGRPAVTSFYLYDIFIILIWFIVINGIYVGLHYYSEWRNSERKRQQEQKIRTGGYAVRQGKENLLVAFDDILSFYAEDGYIILLTWQNRKYFPEKSLDKIEEVLPAELFFRLNRQYIVHRHALSGFRRTGEGKIDVLTKAGDNFPKTIPVSRTRAVIFKNWFQPDEI